MKKILLLLAFLLCASSAEATVYWANVAGGAASCAAASGTSDPGQYRTFAQGVACLTAGDTLTLKAGTYSNDITTLPAGTSWSAPVTLTKAAGETVTLTGWSYFAGSGATQNKYIIIKGVSKTDRMNKTGGSTTGYTNGPRSLRFHYLSVSGISNNNCFSGFGGNQGGNMDAQFIGNLVRDCGGTPAQDPNGLKHGFYLQEGGILLEDNDISIGSNHTGYGVQLQGCGSSVAPIIVRDNIFHENGTESGSLLFGCGGPNSLVYRNVFYQETGFWGCIAMNQGSGQQIYNNTLDDCDGAQGAININGSSSGIQIRNNIFKGTVRSVFINSSASNTVVTHNTWQTAPVNQSGSTTLASNNVRTATFVNEGARDYSLPEGSPEIDAGIDVGLPFNSCCPDRGAREFVGAGGPPPPDPPVGGHQSSLVATGTPNVINLTFVPTAAAITSCTAGDFAVVVAGGGRTVTGVNHTANFTADLTFNGAAVTNGQTVTLAYSGTSCVAGAETIATWTAVNVSNQVDAPPPDPPIGGFASGSVLTASPNVVNLTFQSTVDPVTSCAFADFTVNVATANRASTDLTHTGASTATITFDGAAVTSGQAVTLAYAGTSCVSGASTIATWTAQAVSNEVDAPATFSFANQSFRVRDVRAAAASPTWKTSAANLNYTTFPGGVVRIRYVVACADGPCSSVPLGFLRSINGGAYSAINDGAGDASTCSDSNICMFRGVDAPDIPVDGAATTQVLGSGVFVGGQVKRKNNVLYTTPLMATGDEIEIEGIFAVQSGAAVGTTIDIDLTRDDTESELCTTTCNIPRITVVTPSASGGF